MSTTARILVLTALVALGCGGPEPAPAPEPEPEARPEREQRVAVSRSDGDRSRSRKGGVPEGHVVLDLDGADLAQEVLPLFEREVGVRIKWEGTPRRVSLRLAHPVPWDSALELVCQFTDTHLTRDYKGEWVLKDGWSGTLGSDQDIDELLADQSPGKARSGSRGARSSRGARTSRGGGRRASGGATSAGGADPSPFGPAYSGGEEAKAILKGTTTKRSSR